MNHRRQHATSSLRALLTLGAVAALIALPASARAQQGNDRDRDRDGDRDARLRPGNLLVSRSVYLENPALGLYPFVWNNDLTDPSFGITSRIFLDQLTLFGERLSTIEVPNSTQRGVPPTKDQLVTSFSSKSELALNLSTDGSAVTFMGYVAPVNAVDVSNSNTPLIVDPTNPVTSIALRAAAVMDAGGQFKFTATNAYSGNNGRAAILDNAHGANALFTAGNAGNGSNPQPAGIVLGAGAQIMTPQEKSLAAQKPALPTPVASFSVTQLGAKADKVGKDDNFRGMTVFDDVLYFTKGSGSNGVNTVYFVDTSGEACPNGIGLPARGARLPNMPLDFDPAQLTATGLPSNMCILAGFPSALNATFKKGAQPAFPFGIWFANATTLYVADEGDGTLANAGKTPAGLQKWVFDRELQIWQLAYTLQAGLGLGDTYAFPGDESYPTGINAATGQQWAPVTDGLRNITGLVTGKFATIWGITSTASGNGDSGADPNKLVGIVDLVDNTDPAVAQRESFVTLRTAGFREVLRGVSLTPGSRERQ